MKIKDTETKIEQCIELLTGMVCTETITDNRYTLKLGTGDPLEVGYNKKRRVLVGKALSATTMRYSAKLKMLQMICEWMMDNIDEFSNWTAKNQ